MPCFNPLDAWLGFALGGAKKKIYFSRESAGRGARFMRVPCGKCAGCLAEVRRRWSVRCFHESQMHVESSFITLTYDDDHLPEGGTLVLGDLQKFLKRLRRRLEKVGVRVRYFACGEYGERGHRPHYHVLLFGYSFPDRVELRGRSGSHKLYRSSVLDAAWSVRGVSLGFASVGNVTAESAAYVAGYVDKKVLGALAPEHYGIRTPEFAVMSRRPGIGAAWYEKFGDDTFKHDGVLVGGRLLQPPRYYDQLHARRDPARIEAVKDQRMARAEEKGFRSRRELKVAAKVAKSKAKLKKRSL